MAQAILIRTAIFTFCIIGLNDADSYETSAKPQYDYQASKQRYEAHKSEQLHMLLQKIGSPLPPYSSITNRVQQDIIPSLDEEEEIREKLSKIPGGIGICKKGTSCSTFEKEVMQEVQRTIDYLIAIPTVQEFMKTCAVLRKILNEEIYVMAIISASTARPDTASVQMPSYEYILPYMYISAPVINEARRKVMMAENEEVPIIVDYNFETSSYPNPEDCLAYFREDIAVNGQHTYWHSYNLASSTIRDRKGELFFHAHRQYLARYNAARRSCGLNYVKPFDNFSAPLEEGYNPKLLYNLSGNFYAAREPNTLVRTAVEVDATVPEVEMWRENIYQVIANESLWMRNYNGSAPLPNPGGISVIGEITEPNYSSQYYNGNLYGWYHGAGHLLIGKCNDPDNYSPSGVMRNVPVSMRDPAFYRWHAHIDNVRSKHEMKLLPYTPEELSIPNVAIVSAVVQDKVNPSSNILVTYWKQRQISIQNGVDFGGNNPITVNAMHLQHGEFYHNITVINNATTDISVTVRLYIAPKYDLNEIEMSYENQRTMFITLDISKATVPPGQHDIIRQNSDSSVTIPFGLSFDQLASPNSAKKNYCTCGWPDHMQIPKGTPSGMQFVYFAMLTPGEDYNENITDPFQCATAPNYCGLPNQKYPDKRPMGYPFNRLPDSSIKLASDYSIYYPNIKVTDITIFHDNSLYSANSTFKRYTIDRLNDEIRGIKV